MYIVEESIFEDSEFSLLQDSPLLDVWGGSRCIHKILEIPFMNIPKHSMNKSSLGLHCTILNTASVLA